MTSELVFDMTSDEILSIHQQVDLQGYNTLAVPVTARWFAAINHQQQLQQALAFAQQQSTQVVVLGGGSNLLLPEQLDALVVHILLHGRKVVAETDTEVLVAIAAGENWHQTVLWCLHRGYHGLENLALIPGSVGAAPIQNIGAYGVELAQCFESLEAVNIATGERVSLNREQCQFGYRDSIFKQQLLDKLVITQVTLRLQRQFIPVLTYPALQQQLADRLPQQLAAEEVVGAVMAIRQSKLPDPQQLPNAGSFFKNPVVTQATYEQLRQRFPQLVAYPQSDGRYKLAAGWLLDKAGWKGKMVNRIAMHQQQALVLTNPDRRSARDIQQFVTEVQTSISARFGVQLEIEPRVYS